MMNKGIESVKNYKNLIWKKRTTLTDFQRYNDVIARENITDTLTSSKKQNNRY